MLERKITKNGNSKTVSIPNTLLQMLNMNVGETIIVKIEGNKIIIQKKE